MIKSYTKPEVNVISFTESADIIQTSGVTDETAPIATLAGYDELTNYGAKDFSIFNN